MLNKWHEFWVSKKSLVFIMAIVLAAIGTIANAKADEWRIEGILVPPAAYTHGPFIYEPITGDVIYATRKEWAGIASKCARNEGVGLFDVKGCTLILPGKSCWPFVLKTSNVRQMSIVRIHELAHCRGWKH